MKIVWQNRLKGSPRAVYNLCLVSVDGTDFRIQEPFPFDREINPKWFSQKFKSAGVRYEVGLCIHTGDIVWFSGPFACGMWPDLKIFRRKLKSMLLPREMVVADKGYAGDIKTCTPFEAKNDNHKRFMSRARARHETINGRFKNWSCLAQTWRHDRNKHHIAFKAVATITQLEISNGNLPFQVPHFDDPAFVS